jgi:hypothetical protein
MKIIMYADDAMASEIPAGLVGMKRLSDWQWELTGDSRKLSEVINLLRPCAFETENIDAIFPTS